MPGLVRYKESALHVVLLFQPHVLTYWKQHSNCVFVHWYVALLESLLHPPLFWDQVSLNLPTHQKKYIRPER